MHIEEYDNKKTFDLFIKKKLVDGSFKAPSQVE